MAITPADIEKKTFSTALRGYDLDEVDDFLDEMVVAVRELEEELTRVKARLAELEQGTGVPSGEAAAVAELDESAVGRALVAAQQAADQILDAARSEAERILGEARSEADTFIKERDQRRADMEAEMAEMTGLVAGVRNQLAVLATTVADKLDEMDAVVARAQDQSGELGEAGNGEESTLGSAAAAVDVQSIEESVAESLGLDESDEFGGEDESEEGWGGGETSDDEAGEQEGLEADVEEVTGSEEVDQAGSSEIEGVATEEESREI